MRQRFWTRGDDTSPTRSSTTPARSEGAAEGGFRTSLREAQPAAYVEIVLGLGAIVAINLLFFREDPGFVDLDLHPFWIVVIGIAVRYGALPGYAAGALSALVYFALGVGAGSLGQANMLSIDVLLNPVLFLIAGATVGELREAHKRVHKRLAAKYDEVEEGLQNVAQKYLASLELSRELERRIASQTSTVMTLYEAAKSLENVDTRALSPSVLGLVSSYIDAESCALYLLRDGEYVLEEALPANAAFDRPEVLDTSKGLLALVTGERHTASVHDLVTEASVAQIMGHRILMAAPLLSDDGDVMGILAVEKMPFMRFTPAAVKLFTLLSDWASSAFQRALKFQQTRDRNVEDEITGAYNYFYILKRLGEEVERHRRHGVPVALVAVQVKDYNDIEPVKLPSVLRTLRLIFRRQTRPYDVLGKYSSEGILLLVLPHATVEQAQVVAGRIKQEIEAFVFKPFNDERTLKIATGLASPSDVVRNSEALVEETMRDLRARNEVAG